MAGKLHYTKRKSEGIKLGQIIAKDIRKLVYGNSTNGSGAKGGALRKTVQLDINVQGKNLTDEGLEDIVLALEEVLQEDLGEYTAKLEDINLSGNKLTSVSLRRLANVIELASYDLRDIDLSDNDICVRSRSQGADWESFWNSFHGCVMLRRIDLSHNDLSGPLPFELLWKSYSRQESVDPTDFPKHGPALRYHDASLQDTTNQKMATLSVDDTAILGGSPTSLSDAMIMKRRRGLRAVPYIILNDTRMTDSGALHFSYILPHHYLPQQLVPQGKTRQQSALLEEKAQTNSCWGLVYTPNDSLSTTGRRLLSVAENLRQELIISDDVAATSSSSYEIVKAKQASPLQHRISSERGILRNGGSALSSSAESGSGPFETHTGCTAELDHLRKKIARSTIEELKLSSSQLWSAALKALGISRTLLVVGPRPPFPAPPELTRTLVKPSLTRIRPISLISQQLHDQRQQTPVVRAFQFKLKRLELRNRYTYFPTAPNLLGQLPAPVWHRILDLVLLDGIDAGVLSDDQQRSVRWCATDRSNMVVLKKLLEKGKPFHTWTTLEWMGCLTYDFPVW